jgi:hypothetical protein
VEVLTEGWTTRQPKWWVRDGGPAPFPLVSGVTCGILVAGIYLHRGITMNYLAAIALVSALYFCIKWAVAAGMEKDRLKVRDEADEKAMWEKIIQEYMEECGMTREEAEKEVWPYQNLSHSKTECQTMRGQPCLQHSDHQNV